MNIKLNNVKDCHTKQYEKIFVENKEVLKRLEGKYYKSVLSKKYIRIIKNTDIHLIGQTLYLRSVTKCRCTNGICHTCYGDLAKVVEDVNAGIISASIISSRFTQLILSSKHLLMTKSQKIEFGKQFDKYFMLDGNQIFLDSNNIDNKHKLFLKIRSNDLNIDLDEYSVENFNPDSEEFVTTEELTCNKFDIVTIDGEVVDTIQPLNDLKMSVDDYMYELIERYGKNKKIVLISLDDIEDDGSLFTINVNNAELTKTLNLVKDLLEKEDHLGCVTIDELVSKLNSLLIEGKLYANIVHCEVLCKNLMRSISDKKRLPNLEIGEEYKLVTVKKALMTHPSPILSLAFERLKEQIKGTLLFRKRGSCMFDNLFREKYHRFYELKEKDLVS